MENILNLRPIFFIIILSCLIILQILKPSFKYRFNFKRLSVNTILFILSIIFMKIAFPFGLYKFAEKIQNNSMSIFKLHELSLIPAIILGIIIFDLIIYWQHRIFHVFDFLWRAHSVHHADTEMEVTMALRFHPVEIVISGLVKMIVIYLIGPYAIGFLIYEIILNAMALYTHANIKYSLKLDKFLRYFIVTPYMHYPHHSPSKELINMNYGNFLSLWDRIFNSYTDTHNSTFGVNYVSKDQADDIKFTLMQPFVNIHKRQAEQAPQND